MTDPMNERDLYVLSEQTLARVVEQIPEDAWDKPAGAHLSRGRDVTIRQVINDHAYDDIEVPDILAGLTVADSDAKHGGRDRDYLGDDPKDNYGRINVTSQAAARGCQDLDKVVHLSYGDFPAREYFKHIAMYRTFQAWEIARDLGLDDTLPLELIQGMEDLIVPNIDDWRAMGIFPSAVEVPEDADPQTKLLAATGFWWPESGPVQTT